MSDGPLAALEILGESRSGRAWESLPEIWDAYASERAAGRSPFAGAVRAAAGADRLAQAFAVGYPAALERLLPGVQLPSALCATEAAGNSPRAIETTLREDGEGYRLSGTKTFVTFGSLAKTLIIVARAGLKADGRPEIVVVQIPAEREGVSVEELPPTPFVPEVVHARLELNEVPVLGAERLPGDGYLRYVKPFRTVEDIHVIGATLGYLVGWSRRVGPTAELLPELSSILIVLDALHDAEPLDPRVHVALHGCLERLMGAVQGEGFASLLAASGEAERGRWERDRSLLGIAGKARAARYDRAMQALS